MNRKGFTLIEILIVLIVIGILATLMMPQISGMAERARSAEAKQTIAAIRQLLVANHHETGLYPPTMVGNDAVNGALGTVIDTAATLFNYTITTRPSFGAGSPGTGTGGWWTDVYQNIYGTPCQM